MTKGDEVLTHKKPIPHDLNSLSDVTIAAPFNRQVLSYDAVAKKWINLDYAFRCYFNCDCKTLAFGLTRYMTMHGYDLFTLETDSKTPLSMGGYLYKLYLNIISNSLDGSCVFTVRKNGADTTLIVTVLAGSTGLKTNNNMVAVSVADLIDVKIDTSACASGSVKFIWTLIWLS